MYEITHLYVVTRREISVYKKSDKTPKELREYIDLNTKLFVAVRQEIKNSKNTYMYFGLDYSKMITDHKQTITYTWDDLEKVLTDALVLGYNSDIPGYMAGSDKPAHQIVSWDVMNVTNTFDLNYADYRSGIRGVFAMRWNLKDLRIALRPGASPHPVLKNSIPIINGVTCCPVYRESENALYAVNGAKMAWQEEDHRTPEVQLLDLSELGDITIDRITRPTSEFTDEHTHMKFCNRQNTYDSSCDWAFETNKSLYEYTPILIIGGIIVWPDQMKVTGEHRFTIAPYTIPFGHALLMEQYFGDDTNTDADISFETDTMKEYLANRTDIRNADIPFDFFIVYVKTPHIYVNRIFMDMWDNAILLNLYAKEGILLHNATGSIRVFHRDVMSDRKELTIQNLTGFAAADMLIDQKQYGAFPGDKYARANIRNIMNSDCTMLHVMR